MKTVANTFKKTFKEEIQETLSANVKNRLHARFWVKVVFKNFFIKKNILP